eukprot:s1509_g11.t1
MVAEKDRLIFKSLALSLTPFAASQATFKILADDNRISCDPTEILEACDPGDSLPLALLREAVQGISHFGRRAQARLVLLGAALLDELPQRAGGLRRAGHLADAALQKLGIAKTQGSPETASGVIPARQPEKKAPAMDTKFSDLLLGDISDDVSWFFSTDVGEQLDVTDPVSTEADLDIVDASTALHRPDGLKSLLGDSMCSVSDELCRRCAAYAATALDKSGSGAGQQCFVYGRIRPVQPRMTLRDGIVCHIPHSYIAARGSVLAKLVDMDGTTNSKVLKTIFLDADLTSSAYASCAPSQRRLKEQLVQSTVTGGTQPVNLGVLFASEEHDKLLVENLHSLKSYGFEAVILSGDFSEAVASASCDIGLLVAGGIPARLIHALAADCGAEVLHGLPDCGTFSHSLDILNAKRGVNLKLRDLPEGERTRCFCYPLLGRRQSLLPEVSMPEMDGFWEIWAWAERAEAGSTGMPCTVLLEASCEPQMRQSFAELSDSVLAGLENVKHADHCPTDSLIPCGELPCYWMLKVADALEEVATSEAYPTLLAAEEQAPLVAPWVSPVGDATGDKAACAAFAASLRRVVAMEEGLEELVTEDFKAATAILQRASRLAGGSGFNIFRQVTPLALESCDSQFNVSVLIESSMGAEADQVGIRCWVVGLLLVAAEKKDSRSSFCLGDDEEEEDAKAKAKEAKDSSSSEDEPKKEKEKSKAKAKDTQAKDSDSNSDDEKAKTKAKGKNNKKDSSNSDEDSDEKKKDEKAEKVKKLGCRPKRNEAHWPSLRAISDSIGDAKVSQCTIFRWVPGWPRKKAGSDSSDDSSDDKKKKAKKEVEKKKKKRSSRSGLRAKLLQQESKEESFSKLGPLVLDLEAVLVIAFGLATADVHGVLTFALAMLLWALLTPAAAVLIKDLEEAPRGPKNQDCLAPANDIVRENCKTGNPATEWDINGAGSSLIQGFATQSSYAVGEEVLFKVKTNSRQYRFDIYRLGWYNGLGARQIATLKPVVQLPQEQPECHKDDATLLVDCSTWAVSGGWTIPDDIVPGVFFARLVMEDPPPHWRTDASEIQPSSKFANRNWDYKVMPPCGSEDCSAMAHAYGAQRLRAGDMMRNALKEPHASHVYFVIRQDTRKTDILLQTIDTTWRAYNNYASPSTYGVLPLERHNFSIPESWKARRAYKVSYNAPLVTRDTRAVNTLFNAEMPAIRWLESHGYDIQYWTGADAHSRGAEIAHRAKVYVSVGHDEYWSGEQRRNVEAARDSGVHLHFWSGNEVYWKVRWEASPVDGTPMRTMVVYKESQESFKIDPASEVWTGTFRDSHPFNPEGSNPENSLTGTIFTVNAWRNDALEIPGAYSKLRVWRNTTVASLLPHQKAILLKGLLGHEWDEDLDNGFRPQGLIRLSETHVDNVQAGAENTNTNRPQSTDKAFDVM